ncbi:hypothetical protein EDC01DRAFT_464961 [Geopyxis carbonaria]|nr:hypothetical protein EDC01DRAFT_464961 [Geopyxis carbonaria]
MYAQPLHRHFFTTPPSPPPPPHHLLITLESLLMSKRPATSTMTTTTSTTTMLPPSYTPAPPPPTTYTLSANTAHDTTITPSHPAAPTYHLPAALTTTLPTLSLTSTVPVSSTLASNSSDTTPPGYTRHDPPPRSRDVLTLSRHPFLGITLTSPKLRATLDFESRTVRLSAGERPVLRLADGGDTILGARGETLATVTRYKSSNAGEAVVALELAAGVEGMMRDLVVATWVAETWERYRERPSVREKLRAAAKGGVTRMGWVI